MTESVRSGGKWIRHPLYRHGMLVVIAGLLGVGVWEIFAFRGERHHANGLVVPLMLLLNHVVESFLSEETKKKVRLPQFILIGAGFFYIVYSIVQVLRER